MENEIWKDVKNYEGLYQISNLGKVKSLNYNKTGKEKILKQGICRGYCYVSLYQKGETKHCRIHRLVAQAFLPNPDNLPIINHKNEIKTDNCASNLEWVTQKYNINYGTRNEKCAKVFSKPILQFNREGTKIIGKWDSTMQVERELGIKHSHISQCCNGKLKTAGKYRWLYLEDYVNRMEKLYNLALKKVG